VTASTSPTVVSYWPEPCCPLHPPGLDTDVTATFSKDMDPVTITGAIFTLSGKYDPNHTPVAATVTYDAASKMATLDPSVSLSDSTQYTALIKSGSYGVKDLQGNSLAQDFSWTFMPCEGGLQFPPSLL
jgi:Bacterial Ig-like domain